KDCKYDAFKVKANEEAAGLTVTKDAAGTYDQKYVWTIKKEADQTLVKQSDTSADITYTVTVGHDSASTRLNYHVSGTITAFNPNDDPVLADISDAIDDPNASCSVTGGTGASVAPGFTQFPYDCDFGGNAPASSDETNTATVSWADQNLLPNSPLAAGSSDFSVGF